MGRVSSAQGAAEDEIYAGFPSSQVHRRQRDGTRGEKNLLSVNAGNDLDVFSQYKVGWLESSPAGFSVCWPSPPVTTRAEQLPFHPLERGGTGHLPAGGLMSGGGIMGITMGRFP